MNEMVLGVINALLTFLLPYKPAVVIFGVAFFISGIMAIVNKKVMSTPKARELKEKLKKSDELRKEITDAQKLGDAKKIENLTKKSLELQSKYMSEHTKLMLKPMIISILLVFLILPWLQTTYKGVVVASVPVIIPYFGGKELTWIWWYVLSSLCLSIVIRKILGE